MGARIPIDEQAIARFCRRWDVIELALFGSVVRDDFRTDSDVDVLVAFAEAARRTLRDLIQMEDELRQLLGRDVDLVERRAVEQSENYIRRSHILRNLERVYVA